MRGPELPYRDSGHRPDLAATPRHQAALKIAGLDAEGFADVPERERCVGLGVITDPTFSLRRSRGIAPLQLDDCVEQDGEQQPALRRIGRTRRQPIEVLLGQERIGHGDIEKGSHSFGVFGDHGPARRGSNLCAGKAFRRLHSTVQEDQWVTRVRATKSDTATYQDGRRVGLPDNILHERALGCRKRKLWPPTRREAGRPKVGARRADSGTPEGRMV